MSWVQRVFRNPFSTVFSRSSRGEQLAAYVIREHSGGRTVEDILNDPYIRNRASETERRQLLERPEVIRAIGEHTARMGQPSDESG